MSINSNGSSAMNGSTPSRVVITGIGAVTPLALSVPATWEKLLAGQSGIDYISTFDTGDLRVNFAGEVRGFDPGNYMYRKEARRLGLLRGARRGGGLLLGEGRQRSEGAGKGDADRGGQQRSTEQTILAHGETPFRR